MMQGSSADPPRDTEIDYIVFKSVPWISES